MKPVIVVLIILGIVSLSVGLFLVKKNIDYKNSLLKSGDMIDLYVLDSNNAKIEVGKGITVKMMNSALGNDNYDYVSDGTPILTNKGVALYDTKKIYGSGVKTEYEIFNGQAETDHVFDVSNKIWVYSSMVFNSNPSSSEKINIPADSPFLLVNATGAGRFGSKSSNSNISLRSLDDINNSINNNNILYFSRSKKI